MPLEFDAERLKSVEIIRTQNIVTVRFLTHILYFETLTRLREIVTELAGDRTVEALFFEAEGKNFLLGADVDYFYEAIQAGRQDRIMTYSDLGNDLFDAIERLGFPVVAKINGAALGGGFELALACSGRVATPNSSFAFPETGLGIFPGWGGIKRLRRRIGPELAKWIILTGKTVSAAMAAELKIVDQLSPAEELDSAGKRRVEQIRRGDPVPASTAIPDSLRPAAKLFLSPVTEILARTPSSDEESRLIAPLRQRAPHSLLFAERIADHADLLPPDMERRFEDTLTWQIYHTPDAERGLGHVRAGKLGKPHFTGESAQIR